VEEIVLGQSPGDIFYRCELQRAPRFVEFHQSKASRAKHVRVPRKEKLTACQPHDGPSSPAATRRLRDVRLPDNPEIWGWWHSGLLLSSKDNPMRPNMRSEIMEWKKRKPGPQAARAIDKESHPSP
jgi:hypothetical protein